jgi:adenosylcobinamide-GDP ribazoletransferase
VLLAAGTVLPAGPAVLLAIAATSALTGALHEDGLADTFDGVAGGTRERALAIMRDSRIGVYGALALGLTLALKATALAAMPAGLAAAALVAGHAASRLSCLVVVATSRYARDAGTAGFAAAGVGGLAVAVATGALSLAGVLVLAGGGGAVAGVAGLVAGHLLARAAFERRLGGYTGDCLGATQQLSEAGLYLGVVAWL